MEKNLVRNVGSIGQDNLIAKLTPAAECFGIKLAALSAKGVVKRGTLLYANSDGNYVIYNGKGSNACVPSAILADDVEVGTTAAETAVAYRCGNFNPDAIIVASGYTLTTEDIDTLRKYDIIFTQMI